MKITESKLKQIIKDTIKESLNEDFKGKDYLTILEIKKKVLECYSMAKSIDNQPMMKAFEDLWSAISKTKFGTIDEAIKNVLKEANQDGDYDGKYDEYIKEEIHNLAELERKVPRSLEPDIHSMVVILQGMYSDIQRNRDLDRI